MDKYEVTIKSKGDNNTWTMMWNADSFQEAEQLTKYQLRDTNQTEHNEIIKITKDYDES